MFKREFKSNFKSLVIWSVVISIFLSLIMMIYPSIVESSEKSLDELLQSFPKEILQVFNMDKINLDSYLGWLLSEGYMFITLIGGCFFSILGSTLLLKEQSEGTINFLYSKPITKNKIVTNKLLVGILYVLIFNSVIAVINAIGLAYNNDFEFYKWFLMSTFPMLLNFVFLSLGLVLSNFLKRTQAAISLSIGVVFCFYITGIISMMEKSVEFLKYISPFEYVNSRYIIDFKDFSTIYLNVGILSIIVLVLVGFLCKIYNKKELGL